MIDIKDISGNIRFSTPINTGSKRKFTLQKEDYITLKFSLTTPMYFKLGDWVDDPRFGRFELCDLYKPTYNESTGGYDYELRLDAYYWKWKNKIFKFTPETGGQEASWNLTATLSVQMDIFLRNLKTLGYKYKNTEFTVSVDDTVEDSSKLMSYDKTNLLDALTKMAEAWECEWWIIDSVIHFGRCEYGDPVDFESGKNVDFMTRSDSQTNFATRVYAFGSTRNLPSDYRPIDESIVVNGVVQKRLALPSGTPYIDAYPNMSTEEAIEDVVVFEDVYPHRVGIVSDVVTHEYKDIVKEDGKPDVIKKWNAYRFKDSGIFFSESYVLPGQELKIRFQSGALNGMEFEVWFNPCDKEGDETPIPEKNEDGTWNPLAQIWEIKRNENYGRSLPDDILYPKGEHMEGDVLVPGDTYILEGFDTKFVSATMIPEAEKELKEKAEKYIAKSKSDPSTYDVKMMSDYIYGINPETGEPDTKYAMHFELGDRVKLVNSAFFDTGNRQSRIIGFEYNLDIPYDSPVYTIGETASYSRLGDLESKIESLTYQGQTYTGNRGSGVYVIGTNDSTPSSNRNVFSALKSLASFIRKDTTDTAQDIITFLKGIRFGNYTDKTGGLISIDEDGRSYAEVDYLKARIKAYFETLEIQNVNSVGGKQIITPGGSIKSLEVTDREMIANEDGSTTENILDYYKCTFLSEQDGVKVENRFQVGDLAMSQNFNIKEGINEGVTNHYYWREVVAVGDNYIGLSKTKADASSDIPVVGDVICQLGNVADKTRQNALIFSTVDLFSPSITLYAGIDSYSYLDKDYISYGVDKQTNEAYFNVYGNMYVGNRDLTSYIKYTQKDGVQIKGNLTTLSGKDVDTTFSGLQDQIDGVKETFYGEYTPDLTNYPAIEWTTEALKNRHEGDVFTNIQAYINDETTPDAGKSWRWIKNEEVWGWIQIADNDTAKALKEAALANKAAKEAATSANNANDAVHDLRNFTDEAFKDGVISRSEASSIETYINNVTAIQNNVIESYDKVYNNTLLEGVTKSNLNTAYTGFIAATNELLSTIQTAISDGQTTTIEKAAVDGKFSTFNVKYKDFIGYLNTANNFIQDKINATANSALTKVIDLDYLSKALDGTTLIDGGLVLTSTIGTGCNSTEGFKLMTGISGIYDESKRGGGIAAWYGGSMKDLFDYTEGSMPVDVAKGLIRMDGTGYFASGNLWWEKDGTLHADPLSFFVGEESVGSLLALFQFVPGNVSFNQIEYVIPQKPFQKLEIAEKIQIGDGIIKWNSAYNSFVLEKKDGTEANLIIQGGTAFYGNPTGVPIIFDGLPIDHSTIYWEDGILKAQGGGGGLSQVTIKLGEVSYQSVDGVVSLPAYPTMPDLGKYVTLDTDQTINGVKTFGNYVQTNGFRSINNSLLFYDAYPNTWYTPNAIQTDDWYCNNKTNTGLYNNAENARWYAGNGCWNSDKEIHINGYGVYHSGNIGGATVRTANYLNVICGSESAELRFFWNGKTGQPDWLWGGNSVNEAHLYNPSNFSVDNARKLQGFFPAYDAIGNTAIIRTVEGYVKATYYNTACPIENVGSTFFMEKDGDGFIRKSSWHWAQYIINQSQHMLDLRDAIYDQNTWYPCTVHIAPNQCVNIKIFNSLVGNFNKPSWSTHASGFTLNLQWSVTGNGWGTTNIQRTIKNNHSGFTDGFNPCGGIGQSFSQSLEVVWLRGGAIYYYNIDNANALTVHKDGFTDNAGTFWGTRNSTQLVNPLHCYNTSMFAATDIHTNGLKILELPSVENTWNKRFNNSEGAIVQTTPYNGRYDQFITANSYQPLARWSNTINGVGYPTTYAIGSSRGGNTWGYMTFSVSNADNGSSGYQLQLRGDGLLYWSGEIVTETNITGQSIIANNLTINGNITCSNITANQNIYSTNITSTEYYARNWIRSLNSGCGWFNERHGGGIYMNDDRYVKVYNGKSFRVDGTISAGEGIDDDYGYINVCRPSNINNASCFSWVRSGIIAFALGYNSNNEIVIGQGANNRTVIPWLTIGATTSVFYSDLIIHGDTTFDTSDMTKKTLLSYINDVPIEDIANTPLFTFTWKDHRNSRNHMGTSAQYMQTVLPLSVREVNGELAHSYALSGFTYAVILARNFTNFITDYKSDKEKMQEEINTLKERIEKLERREVCQ